MLVRDLSGEKKGKLRSLSLSCFREAMYNSPSVSKAILFFFLSHPLHSCHELPCYISSSPSLSCILPLPSFSRPLRSCRGLPCYIIFSLFLEHYNPSHPASNAFSILKLWYYASGNWLFGRCFDIIFHIHILTKFWFWSSSSSCRDLFCYLFRESRAPITVW